MSPLPFFHQLPLDSISCDQDLTLHPFQDDCPSHDLQQSMRESGILHPPIVQPSSKGTYNLICGRKRLHALRYFFQKTHFTFLVIPAELSASALVGTILTDQQLNGPLSVIEIAFFLRRCLETLTEEETATLFLPRLGYKQQVPLIYQLVRYVTLETKIQQLIHNGEINDKVGLELLELVPSDRLLFAALFEGLQLGAGKQKRLLTLSREIVARNQGSVSSLFSTQEFNEILTHPEMNPPQKAHCLLELLQKMAFSRSGNAELIFKNRVKKMGLPDNYEIIHSPHFEKNEVFLKMSFPDLESCEKAWNKQTAVHSAAKTR